LRVEARPADGETGEGVIVAIEQESAQARFSYASPMTRSECSAQFIVETR
jgi:hypothetical protein